MKCFYDLPAELRNEIYRMALPSGISYNSSGRWHPSGMPGLLTSSPFVRAEAMPMWFATNYFYVENAVDSRTSAVFDAGNNSLRHVQEIEWRVQMRTDSPAVKQWTAENKGFGRPLSNMWVDITVSGNEVSIYLETPETKPPTLKVAWMAECHLYAAEAKAMTMIKILEKKMGRALKVVGIEDDA